MRLRKAALVGVPGLILAGPALAEIDLASMPNGCGWTPRYPDEHCEVGISRVDDVERGVEPFGKIDGDEDLRSDMSRDRFWGAQEPGRCPTEDDRVLA